MLIFLPLFKNDKDESILKYSVVRQEPKPEMTRFSFRVLQLRKCLSSCVFTFLCY